MVSVKRILSYLFLWTCSYAWMTPSDLRQEYNHYLTIFKKHEKEGSFDTFKHNYQQVSGKQHHYLTQDSDDKYNEYFSSPAIYIYKLKSREQQNQKILLCV